MVLWGSPPVFQSYLFSQQVLGLKTGLGPLTRQDIMAYWGDRR